MKRTFAMLLALVMVLSMVPFAAFAAVTPQPLTIGENTAVLTGSEDGVEFSWTAPETGTLTVTMPEPNADYVWEYYVDNEMDEASPETHYGDGYENDGVPVVAETIDVTKDDEVLVYVNITDENFDYVAGTLTFTAAFETAAGSESQPIELLDSDTTDGAVITADITVAAHKTLYYSISRIQNMILTVTGEGSFTVNCGGQSVVAADGVATIEGVSAASMYAPLVFSVENTGAAALSAQVKFTFPLGAYNNPEVIEELGSLTTTLEAGDSDGYNYIWTATEAGVLSFDINMPKAALNADIVLTNQNSYDISSLVEAGVETVFGEELTYTTVSTNVEAGDVVLVTVAAVPVEGAYPAMTVESVCYFTAPAGTEDNPFQLSAAEVNEVKVAAGATVYCCNTGNVNGMLFNLTGGAASVAHNDATYTTADGAVSFTCVQASTNEPAMFVITNTGSQEATYTVSFSAPLGAWENPEVLALNVPTTATVKAGSNGYNYTWTAEEEGVFTVTVDTSAANGWFYTITNNSTGVATDEHTSALYDTDGNAVTPVTSDSVEVYAGDEVIVTVNTYDSANVNAAPAGSVTITASFVAGEIGGEGGEEGGDNDDVPSGGEIASGTDVTASADAPVTFEYTPAANGTMTLVISGTKGFKVEVFDPDGATVGLPRSFSKGTEQTLTFDLTAGMTYTARIVGYVNYDEGTSVVTYVATWQASGAGGEVEKTEYQVDYDQALVLGDNTLMPLQTAVTTIYAFEPTETGVYRFTVPAYATVGYWGAGEWFLQDPGSDSNVCEWTCTGVGQSAYIGVSDVDGQFNLNVTRTGEYQQTVIIEKVYENKADLSAFTLPENASLGDYVDVYGQTQTAVLGEDGYYHLNHDEGEIILVDMNYEDIVLSDALKSDRPVMNVYVDNEDGSKTKYDIGNAVLEYEAVMDENGYYPLTEDLIFFYKNYTQGAGTWSYYLPDGGYNEECVWMYCCRTMLLVELVGTEDNPVIIDEMTGHIEVEAGVTYAAINAMYNDRILKVDAPEGVTVTVNGEAVGEEGIVLNGSPTNKVVITAEKAATVNFAFEYPLGSQGNPYTIESSNDSLDGYIAANESVYIAVNSQLDNYVMSVIAEGIAVTMNGQEVEVPFTLKATGPVIAVVLKNTSDAEQYFSISISEPAGSENNPIALYENKNTVENSGTKWYQGFFNGMIMTVSGENFTVSYNGQTLQPVNGVVTTAVASANPRMPVIFAITGEGTFQVNFEHPLGNSENPAELVIGENTAEIAADSWGYYYTWTAPAAGTLTITMPEGDWSYAINNMTTGVYGDMQWSDSDPVVNPAVIEVAEGDELQIIINTYDPNAWATPAGTIVFTAAFAEEGSSVDPELNGLVPVDGVWGYYEGGVLQVEYTGLVPYGDILFYVENGILDFTYTGLVWHNDAWRYVANSQLTEGYTGLVWFNDNWFYTVDSVIDWTFTGLVPYEGNYFYVQNNLLDWGYTGLGYHDGGWYFIQNGLLQKQYSGLVYFNDNWFYVEEGVLTYQYFGMVEYQGNLFYVQASHLDWNYTGLGFHEGNWYYFQNALYMPEYNGLAVLEGNYFYVVNGILDWSVNGLREVNGVLYYFTDSLLDWSYYGPAEYNGVTYDVVGGIAQL